MYFLQLFPFISQVLIKINYENVSLSELSLEGRREQALARAGTEGSTCLGARAGDCCRNTREGPHRQGKMGQEKPGQVTTTVSFHQEISL